MSWEKEKLGNLLIESKILSENPDPNKRIRVKLNVGGVEKRPLENEVKGATKQFIRKANQFIYGKQNFHKGAFGIIPNELDGFESSSDIPSFDVRDDCMPEWIYYYFKSGNRYLSLEKLARGVGSKRIHPQQLNELTIPLPDTQTQRLIIDSIKNNEKIIESSFSEISNQLKIISQLRQAFLREAMQGKLTESWRKAIFESHPELVEGSTNSVTLSDGTIYEPASELLKRIKAEKEKLIAEGKIKKQKPLPEIKPEEIPYEIPPTWVWCRLGQVGEMRRGKSKHRPRNDTRLFVNGNYPFIQTGDVSQAKFTNDLITTINGYYNDFGLRQSELQNKDTLCITIAANIAECGFLNFDACVPDSIVCFDSIDSIITKFVFYYIKVSQSDLERYATATSQKNINLTILNSLLIPLPPLAEQQRIVSKLNELMQFSDQLEQNINATKEQTNMLLQTVLREALE